MPSPPAFEVHEANLHGHRAVYRTVGSGPTVVLIHGMINSSRHWETVAQRLAGSYRVIAPDLIGHGDAATPRGDYSLGAHAASIRDLLTTIGVERATIVGHSLGGGVAMQFTYQFPEMVERLVLVSSGGLGPDVSPILRAAALPGAELFISATAGVGSRVGSVVGRGLGLVGLRPNTDLAEVTRGYATLTDPDRRKAFVATLRSVVGTKGQRIAALDKLYLAEALPLLIVWGENDPIIPVEHARETHAQLPTSHLEIFEDTGHVPQLERPGRFIATLERFLAETEPAEFDRDEWRARFKAAEN